MNFGYWIDLLDGSVWWIIFTTIFEDGQISYSLEYLEIFFHCISFASLYHLKLKQNWKENLRPTDFLKGNFI